MVRSLKEVGIIQKLYMKKYLAQEIIGINVSVHDKCEWAKREFRKVYKLYESEYY